ncbi:MAG TPA: PIN domain-containing protein, partial [Tepidisphaeraceae bacterium]
CGEILFGLGRLAPGRRRTDLEQKAQQIFAVLACEPVPPTAAEHYATVKLTRGSKGLSLDENDLWIAAVALSLGATLVSRDSDVRGISGLTVEDWTT